MQSTLLNAVAIPECEDRQADLVARLNAIADDLAQRRITRGVDWEQVIDMGAGPGLALGVERRLRPR